MGFISRTMLVRTPWSCPSWAHHHGPSPPTKTKGRTAVKEVAHGQLGDLMLPGLGSQQTTKSPLGPGDSSTPEGRGDRDATSSLLLPLRSHHSMTLCSRASHIPLPRGHREGLGDHFGLAWLGAEPDRTPRQRQLSATERASPHSPKPQAQMGASYTPAAAHKHTPCCLPRRGPAMTSCIFSILGLRPQNPWWPNHTPLHMVRVWL